MPGVVDTVVQMVTPQLGGQIAKFLETDTADVQQGVKIGAPLITGALAAQANTGEGADKILAMLPTDHGDPARHVMSSVTSGAGEDLVDTLFGAGENKVAATIRDATGFDIAPYLPVVAPMVMTVLANTVKEQHLDSAGLTALLKTETANNAKTDSLLSQQVNIALEAGDQVVANAAQVRARFDDQEWETLTRAPALAGFAVMMSSLSGPRGMTKEIVALADTLSVTAHQMPGDSLVSLVSHEFKTLDQLNALGANHTNAAQLATESCALAVAILENQAKPEELIGYKEFVYGTASNVASAAREGTFLGLGGTPINAEEQAMLARLAEALKFKP